MLSVFSSESKVQILKNTKAHYPTARDHKPPELRLTEIVQFTMI